MADEQMYSVLELEATTASALRLQYRRFPVRSDQISRIRGDGRTRIDLLVDEVDLVVGSADDETADRLGPSIARLALVAAREADSLGMVERAAHYAILAQVWAPGLPDAAAMVAIALLSTGDLEGAAKHFDRALLDDDAGNLVGMRILAARAASTSGNPARARDLLEPVTRNDPKFDEFWTLYSLVTDEADLLSSGVPTAVVPPTGATWRAHPHDEAETLQRLAGGRVLMIDDESVADWFGVRTVDGRAGFVGLGAVVASPRSA